ncbi:MAG: SH3 domain-containing protein [Acutalibacteraceae bacterium]|nr:SH3 domain-containing protein [Acutalibacteraceae bacterium]
MKKYNKIILSVIMTIVMVCTVIVPISVSAASQKGVVTGITSYLNVRSSPGTGYSSIGKLYNNETVTVVGSATGDGIDWYKIEFDDGYGYVSAEFIKLIEDDTDFEKYLTEQGFPESYKDGLRTIHEQHPEWIFVAQHIGPDWATVIRNESKVGVNLVPASSPAEQKSFEENAFDFEKNTWKGLDGSWVAASEQIVSWAIDPRNFLDDSYIFQFEKLSYVSDHTLDGINGILSGTFMTGEYPDDEFSSFAEAIMQAAKQSQVSA